MKTDPISTAVGIVLCLALSAVGIYCIVSPVQRKMKENVRIHQESGEIGPLDDAFADLAGVPRKPKPTIFLPEMKPIEFSFDQGFDNTSSDGY